MEQFITFEGQQIYVQVKGEGPVILFLHGWPTNSQLWNDQVAWLQENFKTITIDWIGFGRSSKPENFEYTFPKMKAQLEVVITKLLAPEEKLTLVAHDIGGPASMLWAHENVHRIERFILLNTVFYPFSTPLDKSSHLFFRIPGINHIIMSRFGLGILMRTLVRTNDSAAKKCIQNVLDWHENYSRQLKIKTILAPMDAGRKKEVLQLEGIFSSLEVEKHLIIAKKDPLCYKHMQVFQSRHPEITNHILAKSGHYIPLDQPQQLKTILKTILK